MNFADTNWIVAMYFEPRDTESKSIRATVDRFMRRQSDPILISRLTFWECRNVFSRVTLQSQPEEWKSFAGDLGSKLILVDLELSRIESTLFELFSRYSRKISLGTFDSAQIAVATLSGADRFLSFDGLARALAAAEGLSVFPLLTPAEKSVVSRLKRA